VNSNYFFYDGLYWVYQRDNWYASSWYNGPWGLVGPAAVPLYVLRVPVRYYRRPPTYFHGWRSDAPPRWDDHWGSSWTQSHGGWNDWNRGTVPAAAPLPVYQRQYSGTRYPQAQQQQVLQTQNYRYQPQDAVVQQHYQAQRTLQAPAAQVNAPAARAAQGPNPTTAQHEQRAPRPPQQPAVVQAPPQPTGNAAMHPAPQGQRAAAPREQQAPKPQQNQKPVTERAQAQSPGNGAQHPSQQPSRQEGAQQQPQAPKPEGQGRGQGQGKGQGPQGQGQGQDHAPQGNGKPQDGKQHPDKGEPQGGEHSK